MLTTDSDSKKVFLSYCHRNKVESADLDSLFRKFGIHASLDERDVEISGSFQKFMESIREHNYCIALVSDDYLKSTNCLFEFLEAKKEAEFWKKIFIFVISPILETQEYIIFWNNRVEELKTSLGNLPLEHSNAISRQLQKANMILSEIGELIDEIHDHRYVRYEERSLSIKQILINMGYNPKSIRVEISKNMNIENQEDRDLDLDRLKVKYKDNFLIWMYVAQLEQEKKNMIKANSYFLKAIELSKDECEPLCFYARFLFSADLNLGQIKNIVEKAERIKPACTDLMLLFARLYIYVYDRFDTGLTYLTRILAIEPENYYSLILMARVMVLKKQIDLAGEYYRRLINLNQEDLNLLIEYADFLHEHVGDKDSAYMIIDKAESIDPKCEMLLILKGTFSAREKKGLGIVKNYFNQAKQVVPDSANMHFQYGQLFSHYYKRDDLAQSCCEKAIELDSKGFDAYLLLADILLEKEKYVEAIDLLLKAVSFTNNRKCIHCKLASVYYAIGEYASAKKHYEIELESNPQDAAIISYLLSACKKLELKRNDVDTIFKKIELHLYNNSSSLSMLAATIYLNYSEKGLVKSMLERAIDLDYSNAEAHNNLGYLLFHDYNLPEEARNHLELSIKLDANLALAYSNLANIYFKVDNDVNKAKKYVNKAKKLDSDDSLITKTYNEIMFNSR